MSKIKPGCGFWDTSVYPYGSKFVRAGAAGVELASIGEPYSRHDNGSVKEYKCSTTDKRIVVVKYEYIQE